ncbi:hypothetical protein GW17_00056248, partial [Ensete ventricosum]
KNIEMRRSESFSHRKPWKLSQAALFGCLLIMTVILVCLIKSGSNTNVTCKEAAILKEKQDEKEAYAGKSNNSLHRNSHRTIGKLADSVYGALDADAATSLTSTTMEEMELDEPAIGG